MLKPGDRAPHFSLPTPDGALVHSTEYLGTSVTVLFFYPKDGTAGCTIEACAFRDAHDAFQRAGAVVIGISADGAASHRAFREEHALPFILASDVDRRTARAYGVPSGPLSLPARVTFVIDRHGIVRDVFSSRIRFTRHVSRALALVRALAAAPR